MEQVLTVAGSDSGAGAGIQADLKTFAAHNVYGTSVITAVTAQNTLGVMDFSIVSPSLVDKQISAVLTDFDICAIKTGMLPNVEIIKTIEKYLCKKKYFVVIDTVLNAKNGKLTVEDTSDALKIFLFPFATIITPNIDEAELLSGLKIKTLDDVKKAAEILFKTGTKNVLIKGGHLQGEKSVDLLFDGKKFYTFENQRINTNNTHGTGCTMASAITANLALGHNIYTSVKNANFYVYELIKNSLDFNIGHGHGPMNHFINFNKET